jgi:NitT/TauT family transport system substrate-binding protein
MRLRATRVQAPWPGPLARRIRPIATLSGGLAAVLVIAGCNPFSSLSSNSSSSTVTVAAVPGVNNANLFLAVHNGYFSRAGVTVKIVRYQSVAKEITALDQGQVDVISADYGDMLWQQAQGGAKNAIYRILADGYDAAPGVVEILTMPNSTVKTATELSGQIIPVPNVDTVEAGQGVPNTLALASATSVLQSDGVNLAAVQWQPMSQSKEIDQLVHGTVHAALLTGTGVYLAEQAGAVELIDACSGPTSNIPLDGFFTTSSWLQEETKNHSNASSAFQQGIYAADAAAAMTGPIQSVLPTWIKGLDDQEAELVTTGTYPLSTIVANLQRTAGLVAAEGMTQIDIDVSTMIVR